MNYTINTRYVNNNVHQKLMKNGDSVVLYVLSCFVIITLLYERTITYLEERLYCGCGGGGGGGCCNWGSSMVYLSSILSSSKHKKQHKNPNRSRFRCDQKRAAFSGRLLNLVNTFPFSTQPFRFLSFIRKYLGNGGGAPHRMIEIGSCHHRN